MCAREGPLWSRLVVQIELRMEVSKAILYFPSVVGNWEHLCHRIQIMGLAPVTGSRPSIRTITLLLKVFTWQNGSVKGISVCVLCLGVEWDAIGL